MASSPPPPPKQLNQSTTPGVAASTSGRHHCFCGKSYIRKEHLRRHQAVHEGIAFVCSRCGASFTRRDLLRRHEKEHTSSRSKRSKACDACHASKTKCNGAKPCASCHLKGIKCQYSSRESQAAASQPDPERSIVVASDISMTENGAELPPVELETASPSHLSDGGAEEASEGAESQSPSNLVSDTLREELKGVLSVLDEDPLPKLGRFQEQGHTELTQESFKRYIEHFHPHWLILHAPTYDFAEQPLENAAIVYLIGAFCWSQADKTLGIEFALFSELHGKLADNLFRWLHQFSFLDAAEKPWPFPKYQAALLTIIFATYLSDEEAAHRAKVLLGALVTSLRTADFFRSQTAEEQREVHFPGEFLPWKYMIAQQRNIIVAHLFKIDAHLAVMTQQPPQLHAWELDVSLSATFSQLNGYGINVFWTRHGPLSEVRRETTMSAFLEDPAPTFESGMLLEDIHIGLSGLAFKAWQLAQLGRTGSKPETANNIHLSLVASLSFWRGQLQACQLLLSSHNALLRSAYLGETEQPDAIMQSLMDETLAFYHLLSMLVAVHGTGDVREKITLPGPNLSRSDFLPPYAMKSLYHALRIGVLCLARPEPRPPILQHAQVFARECLETMLEDSCWCTFSSSRLELASADIQLEEEERICCIPLGKFWVFVDGTPLCACDRSPFMGQVGLADAEGE